jgi:hypothetical protein
MKRLLDSLDYLIYGLLVLVGLGGLVYVGYVFIAG